MLMDELSGRNEIVLEVVYIDEHLIELQATVTVGKWGGQAQAYTTVNDLLAFVTKLEPFAESLTSEPAFVAGAENGIGLVALRFYTIDRAGHAACRVQLASQTVTDHHREEVFKLTMEARLERMAIVRFTQAVRRMAESRTGRAVLTTELAV